MLRPQALSALAGSRLILHAGDVGDPDILRALGEIAPVRAVYGNTDGGSLRRDLPRTDVVEIAEGVSVLLIHILDELDLEPAAAGCEVVLYGHTHEPRVERQGGVWYLNPGSAGPRRFRLPITVGRLHMESGGLRTEIVNLEIPR